MSRQGGGTPWRDETQERIGSHRRLNPADRSTDFRIGLKPLKTRPTPPVFLHATPNLLLGAAEDATWRRGNGSDSDDAPRRDRRQRRQEGHGVLRGVPAVREGKPLKGEPHERRRCETEPAGLRGEQGVKRLRKPGGAAQSGLETRRRSLPVTSCAVGARNLRRVCPVQRSRLRLRAPERTVRPGSNSGATRSSREDSS